MIMNEEGKNIIIKKWLDELSNNIKLLDAGAGELKWKDACQRFRYISQDFCQYDGKGNNQGLQTGIWDTNKIDIVSDITDIPVEADSFDALLCTEVFEHLPYPELAVKEFSRIIRPGGTLILTAPFLSLTHFAPYHYCTGFNIYWYKIILPKYGFSIDEAIPSGDYFAFMVQECLRVPSIYKKYFAKKSFILSFFARIFAKILLYKCDYPNRSSDLCCFTWCIKARKI